MLKFDPDKDNQLKVEDEKVLVADGRGEALVELNPELPAGMTLWLDEGADEVFAVREGPLDGLVCLPATIGTAPGVVTGAATAAACHIAGGALITAASC